MNRKHAYADLEKWRAACSRAKKKYYGKTAVYRPSRYTEKQCEMILEHSITDAELSKLIHHSVESIQVKRSSLKKSMNDYNRAVANRDDTAPYLNSLKEGR